MYKFSVAVFLLACAVLVYSSESESIDGELMCKDTGWNKQGQTVRRGERDIFVSPSQLDM